MILLELYFEFFKIGLFAIGGGMATIPFLRHLSMTTGWFPISFIVDMVAISESTPGPIGINMATYAGYNVGGLFGGLAATLGMVTPSIIIVLVVAGYMEKFSKSKTLEHSFWGLRPAVTGLIAVAGFDIIKIAVFEMGLLDLKKAIFFLVIFYMIKRFNRHPVAYVVVSAAVGILLGF
jgi:chromate transporter